MLTSERDEPIPQLCSVVSDLSVTTVSLTELGFISPVSTARPSARASLGAEAMEPEPGLLSLIGVMFYWTLELLQRLLGVSVVLVPVAGRGEPPRVPGT